MYITKSRAFLSLIGAAMLLPSIAFAGEYCVTLPRNEDFMHRNYTKPLAFQYSYEILYYQNNGIVGALEANSIRSRGNGAAIKDNPLAAPHNRYPYDGVPICLDKRELEREIRAARIDAFADIDTRRARAWVRLFRIRAYGGGKGSNFYCHHTNHLNSNENYQVELVRKDGSSKIECVAAH